MGEVDGDFVAVHLIFRFLGGLCGSAFLSIAGGTVSDMFTDDTVATYGLLYHNPMA